MPVSKKVRKVREAGEFSTARLQARLAQPKGGGTPAFSWSLPDIFAARDDQLGGQFARPARMAAAMRTDDALAVARRNRLAPQRCIAVQLLPAKGRGGSVAAEAEALFGQDGAAVSQGTRADINGCFVDHGVAFAYNVITPRADGTRVDFEVHYFPIEFVRWDPFYRCFKARIDPATIAPADAPKDLEKFGSVGGYEVPIVHGDGRWIVFQTHDFEPFNQDAALLDSAIVWARHAFATLAWNSASNAHGDVKLMGEMPANTPLQKDGEMTREASDFLAMMNDLLDGGRSGIKPAGSKVELLMPTSSAWEVWDKLVQNAEKAAARIYLGTDGVLGSNGGAPGVDISQLFGVASTKVQGDLAAMSRGLQTGAIEPWAALNFGDSALAPQHSYALPDVDGDAARASYEKRRTAFHLDLKTSRENGFVIDQDYVDELAEGYGVEAPQLPPPQAAQAPAIQLAPADIGRVVSVNEARASAGLGALMLPDGVTPDPRGTMTVEQFAAAVAAPPAVAPAPKANGVTGHAVPAPPVS